MPNSTQVSTVRGFQLHTSMTATPLASHWGQGTMPELLHVRQGTPVASVACGSCISLICNQPAAHLARSFRMAEFNHSCCVGSHDACSSRKVTPAVPLRICMTRKCRQPSVSCMAVHLECRILDILRVVFLL